MKLRSVVGMLVALEFIVLQGANSFAHPGHSVINASKNEHSMLHYVTEPFHAIGWIGLLAVVAIVILVSRYRRTANV